MRFFGGRIMEPTPTGLLRRLRKLFDPTHGPGVPDAELLERFVRQRDESAFELLLWRHQRMVLGVCRRVLHDAHDAEDAFQATFLALVQNAGSLGQVRAVAGWLHRVAYHVALRARRKATRRGRAVIDLTAVEALADPGADVGWRELAAVLDGEVNRLPEPYRGPVVLCYLEGKTYREAGRQLGVSVGTLSSRLTRGRALLRARLARRGITLGGAALATLLCERAADASAAATLVNATLKAASALTSGQATAATSAGVVALMEGALRGMFLGKVKRTALALLVGLLVAGLGGLALGVMQVNPAPQAESPDRPRQPVAAGEDAGRVDRHGDPLPPGAVARLGTVRLRHGGAIGAAAFSPDGKLLATGGWDHMVRLWDAATGKPVAALRGHTQSITAVAFSPDGKTLLSSGGDFISHRGGETKLWDVATRGERLTLAGSSADSAAFAPDGRAVATASFGYVHLWDAATGERLRSWSAHPGAWPGGGRPRPFWVYALAYSPDGRTLVTASDDRNVRLWDPQTGQKIRAFAGGGGEVYAAAFSSDGKRLAVSSSDKFDEKLIGSAQTGTIRLWDPVTGKLVRKVATHTQAARCLAFLPGDKQLAVGSYDSGIEAWDVTTGKKVRQLHALPNFAACLAISPDGRRLAAAGWGEHAAVLCDVRTGRQLSPVGGATSRVNAVLFTPDGRVLTSGDADAPLRVWEAATGKEGPPWKGKARDVASMALSPDGKILATGLYEGVIQLWDAATGRELRQVKGPDRGYIWCVAFSPDGRTLAACGNDGKVRLWDVAAGKVTRELTADPRGLLRVAFSPGGATLAASAGDGNLGLWDVASGKLRLRLVGHPEMSSIFSLAFSPDGKLLASIATMHSASTERALRLWEVNTGKELVHLAFGQKAGVHSPGGQAVVFSPDGRTLATAGRDGTVSLWEVATGGLRRRFHGHTAVVGNLEFSADGRTLASASSDTTVLLWDVTGLTPAGPTGRSDGSPRPRPRP
jgi:RNA polymerase sigma factor (sigma-70 family)